jgi:ABC-2 type transport system permease protein
MMFLCGLFIPIERLPALLRPISYALPLTYGADILKTSINQNGIIASWISFSVLIGYSLFLFLMSTRNIQRKWIY